MFSDLCKRKLRLVALTLIIFAMITPWVGSSLFVLTALEQTEQYAGIANPLASGTHSAKLVKVHTSGTPSFVFLHLTGMFEDADGHGAAGAGRGRGILHAVVHSLPVWDLVFRIFHPPKAFATSP